MTTELAPDGLSDFDLETLRLASEHELQWSEPRVHSINRLSRLFFLTSDITGLVCVTAPGRIVLSLVERVRRAEAATAWEPIETAPKDGTPVLLGGWYRNPYAPDPQPFTFGQTAGSWTTHGGGEWVRGFANQPTHWRPLHAPPEKEPDRHD